MKQKYHEKITRHRQPGDISCDHLTLLSDLRVVSVDWYSSKSLLAPCPLHH